MEKVGDEMIKRKREVIPKTISKNQNNEGFSLIELLISITILVLVMIPLMNSFVRSMQLNERAEDIQVESNLAASIMEGLKNLNTKETIKQFTGSTVPFDIITDKNGVLGISKIKVLNYSGGVYGVVKPEDYASLDGQATYYFAICGIQEGGTTYDALIKLDSDTLAYRPVSSTTMNKYPMPDAITLDAMTNGLLFSNGQTDADTMDNVALTTFLQMGEAYARELFEHSSANLTYQADCMQYEIDYTNALAAGSTLPTAPTVVTFDPISYPDYCDSDTVKADIIKTMSITISEDTVDSIEYKINYECNWPTGSTLERTLSYPVSVKNYAKPIENVYLFYKPSVFTNFDVVKVNQTYIDNPNPINFYAAYQQLGTSLLPKLTISTRSSDNISVFTNIDIDTSGVEHKVDDIVRPEMMNQGLINTEVKNRIYEITVQLYEYVDSTNIPDKFKNELYTLKSTREE